MANEKKAFLLTESEHLWDVALRGIGIQLPDEYIIRFQKLANLCNMTELKDITIKDFAHIEVTAREELNERIEKAKKED